LISGWYSDGLATDSPLFQAEIFHVELVRIVINFACIDLGSKLAFLVLKLYDFVIAGTVSLGGNSTVEVKIFDDSLLGSNFSF